LGRPEKVEVLERSFSFGNKAGKGETGRGLGSEFKRGFGTEVLGRLTKTEREKGERGCSEFAVR